MNLLKDLKYLFILLVCASCVDEEQRNNMQETNAVDFSVSVSGGITSRASGTSWEAGDEVGVYMVPAMENATDTADFSTYAPESVNVPYRVAAAGASASLEAVSDKIVYPADGSDVNFVAYYPYSDDENIVTSAGVYKINIADQDPLKDIDLLYHKGNTNYDRKSGSVPLVFIHKLSKLTVNLDTASGFSGDLSNVSVSLSGFPTKVDFDLSADTFGIPTVPAGLAPANETKTSRKYTGEVLLIPQQNIGEDCFITFTIGVVDYKYYFASSTELKSGEEYTYNFKFTGSTVILSDKKMSGGWKRGQSGSWFKLDKDTVYLDKNGLGRATVQVITDSPDKIEITPGTKQIFVDYDVAASKLEEGTIVIKADPDSESSPLIKRTGSFYITVDGTVAEIIVKQKYIESNSYIVPHNSTNFRINPARAFDYGGAAEGATLTVEELWDDNNVVNPILSISGTGANTVVTLITSSNKGNALIAVKEGGVIRWSYHIWVTDYDPNTTGDTYINYNNENNNGKNFVFMDRNLGAKAAGTGLPDNYGLYYQWGRKDPFPTTGAPGDGDFTAVASDATVGTIDYAIAHPNMFITGVASSDYDWLYAARNNTLWGNNTTKSVYDPCPDGWRVPSFNYGTALEYDSPWYGFYSYNNSGWDNGYSWGNGYGDNAVYPAAGFRQGTNGVLLNQSTVGFYGGASINGNNSVNLYFNDSNVYVSRSSLRENGISVRCVKE
jgi:hypothetical protein